VLFCTIFAKILLAALKILLFFFKYSNFAQCVLLWHFGNLVTLPIWTGLSYAQMKMISKRTCFTAAIYRVEYNVSDMSQVIRHVILKIHRRRRCKSGKKSVRHGHSVNNAFHARVRCTKRHPLQIRNTVVFLYGILNPFSVLQLTLEELQSRLETVAKKRALRAPGHLTGTNPDT
jgi:hypothetical protein